jgi:hypothetical protein
LFRVPETTFNGWSLEGKKNKQQNYSMRWNHVRIRLQAFTSPSDI